MIRKTDAWLANDLQKSTAKYKIVYMHHPSYPVAEDKPNVKLYRNIRKNWVPIFEDTGVKLVLNGHQHGIIVEKSPPSVTARQRSIIGNPAIPAAFIPSMKGALEAIRADWLASGVIPTRKNCQRAFTANTPKGAMVRARGRVICGYLTSAPIPAHDQSCQSSR